MSMDENIIKEKLKTFLQHDSYISLKLLFPLEDATSFAHLYMDDFAAIAAYAKASCGVDIPDICCNYPTMADLKTTVKIIWLFSLESDDLAYHQIVDIVHFITPAPYARKDFPRIKPYIPAWLETLL